ncbi:tryptophan-rich sensory protein [Corynebacterium sp. Sa1YVA5]|uniref:Tryptophan-rich sensory protein n=2 Tax=Corynebacterium gallinarum TaxID=2762214 RepID=A0A8I0HRY0_9CORY|nr:tryptophan-rich sensory protein [Corynebacterium gallinarum]
MDQRWRIIGTTSAAVVGTAITGSLATDTSSTWYRRLNKPAIQPPSWVFPVAWTALYVDIATVVGRSLADLKERGDEAEYSELRTSLAINLVLNAGWSALFFKGKAPGPATVEAAALAVSSADLVRRSRAANPTSGAFLLPYAAWTAFATVLTATIWYQNR